MYKKSVIGNGGGISHILADNTMKKLMSYEFNIDTTVSNCVSSLHELAVFNVQIAIQGLFPSNNTTYYSAYPESRHSPIKYSEISP